MELVSDHLKEIRHRFKGVRGVGLFMFPSGVDDVVKRFDTLVALAEYQEEELRLALTERDAVLTKRDLDELPSGTILRFPRRLVIVTSTSGGDDAA